MEPSRDDPDFAVLLGSCEILVARASKPIRSDHGAGELTNADRHRACEDEFGDRSVIHCAAEFPLCAPPPRQLSMPQQSFGSGWQAKPPSFPPPRKLLVAEHGRYVGDALAEQNGSQKPLSKRAKLEV